MVRLVLYVAPCVGAWIETEGSTANYAANGVAPCVGAWIETDLATAKQTP